MRRRITFSLEEGSYNELEHIGKSIGLKPPQAAEFAVNVFNLSIKQSAIKLFLNDPKRLDTIAVEAFQKLYDIDMEHPPSDFKEGSEEGSEDE